MKRRRAQESGLAISTIAMSVYNLAAFMGGEVALDAIEKSLPTAVGLPVSEHEFGRAVQGLKRRRLAETGGGKLRLRDRLARRAVSRDREGDGWRGWVVLDQRRGLLPLAEALP